MTRKSPTTILFWLFALLLIPTYYWINAKYLDPKFDQSLRDLFEKRNVAFGASVVAQWLEKEAPYARIASSEFTTLTPEVEFKLDQLMPETQSFDFATADKLMKFASRHYVALRGHTLVWHESLPPWLLKKSWKRKDLEKFLKSYIETVMKRYPEIKVWDVANEIIDDDGNLQKGIWLKNLGPGYIENIFRWAHLANPKAKLFYNETRIEKAGPKQEAAARLVSELLKKGVPIHGVGIQGHYPVDSAPMASDISGVIKRFADLGLEVHFTELEIRLQESRNPKEASEARQRRVYQDYLRACLAAQACKAFIFWGITDRHSWIEFRTGKPDWPYLYDRDFLRKPLYRALQEVF